jgi:hypothetical protein
MNVNELVASIDAELSRLTEARNLLLGESGTEGSKPLRVKMTAKRKLSPEARMRIAEAQRKRWASAKKTAE